MKHISLARTDWETRIREGRSLVPDDAHGINPAAAQRAVDLFGSLVLPDVRGMPLLSDAAGEWFKEIVGVFLGSIDPTSGARKIRELFALVPKKNSKTSYGAGLMMTALLLNTRPRAELLLVGPTQLISDLAFDQAAGMVEHDPNGLLQKRMRVQSHIRTITNKATGAELKIKTFGADTLTGVKPAGILLDELHEIAKNPRAARIIGQLRGGMLPNPEAFFAQITTQSDEPPSGAFRSELQAARAIRDGRASGAMMPIIYEFPLEIAQDNGHPPKWENPALWHMVTPNLGRSITLDRLVEDFDTAKTKGEEEIRRWASQHLSIEIGVGLHTDRWAGAEYWEGTADPTLTFDEILKRSEVIVVGIDGGGMDDLLGISVLGRERETGTLLHWGHVYAFEVVLERRKDIAAKLLDFKADGDLTIIKRVGDDVHAVADIVEQIEATGLLGETVAVGVDQAGIAETVEELTNRGIAVERIVGVAQGWKLSGQINGVARKLAGGTLRHCGSRMMAWSVGNAKVEARGNALVMTKSVAGSAKIDAVIALLNSAVAMSQNPDEEASVYTKDRGLIFV